MDKPPSVRDVLRNTPVHERIDRCKAARHPMVFLWKNSQLFSRSEVFLWKMSCSQRGSIHQYFSLRIILRLFESRGMSGLSHGYCRKPSRNKYFFKALCISVFLISWSTLETETVLANQQQRMWKGSHVVKNLHSAVPLWSVECFRIFQLRVYLFIHLFYYSLVAGLFPWFQLQQQLPGNLWQPQHTLPVQDKTVVFHTIWVV